VADIKLVLHPRNPQAILQDPPEFMDALRRLGLVGTAFSHVGELHYKDGPRLRELLVFSPALAAEFDASQYHFFLLETTNEPAFLGASNAQPPSCPGCAVLLPDWKKQLSEWQADRKGYVWSCPRCGRRFPVGRVAWGTTGGVARYSLDVWGVPEDGAVPSEELLAALERESGEAWRHFYYRF
jgi:hypothetical protein